MKKIIFQIAKLWLAVGVIGTGLYSPDAQARTVPGTQGKARRHADADCFFEWYGTMKNICADRKSFHIPLVIDNAGAHNAWVTAFGATPANNVGCRAYGLNRETTLYWASPRVWLSIFDTPQVLTLVGAWLPGSGYMYIDCSMNNGGRVHTVSYVF